MKSIYSVYLLLTLLIASLSTSAQKEFVTEDKVYEKNIKTVLLYPAIQDAVTNPLTPPIVSLTQQLPLVLEFDELGNNYQSYYLKIIHCNADWTVSSLSPVQYMNEYDELYINNRRGSVNTRIPYIHYKFTLPPVNMSGNFIVKVYRNYDEDDLILTKRFCVFDNKINVFPTVKFSTDPSVRNINEQVDFNIDYSAIEVINPLQNLKVILRQNHRWDKTISDLSPANVNEEISKLEYFYFNRENNFKGGNEFRRIEIKSAMYNGINISRVKRDSSRAEAFTFPDKSRANEAYVQPLVPDMDGKYYVVNQETGDKEIVPDYMYVTFTLESPTPAPGKVYVFGGMTDWKLDKGFEMKYNSESKTYSCQALLKQGAYDYIYVMADPKTGEVNEYYFEGSYSLTENIYDILVYYRPFGSRADQLLGYKSIVYLGR